MCRLLLTVFLGAVVLTVGSGPGVVRVSDAAARRTDEGGHSIACIHDALARLAGGNVRCFLQECGDFRRSEVAAALEE